MCQVIKMINIRVPESEFELLEWYCKQTGQTKTTVLREYIRSLDPTLIPKFSPNSSDAKQ